MSPPKVNMSGKEPLKAIDLNDEALPSKMNGSLEFPAIVTVETHRNILSRSPNYQKQRARRVICGVAMVIIVGVAALGTMALVHKLRRFHRKQWSCRYGANRLPEHVTVDHHNQLIRVHHDHDQQTKTPAMEVLHEYNRKMVAYKDVDKQICYIDRLDETFETGYQRWETYEKTDRTDKKVLKVISQQPIQTEVVQHMLDIHITEHCMDSQSLWVMEIDEKEVIEEKGIIRI